MASQVPGARSHYLPLRGRASLPGALRPPTNHEERWGDHSFALDSVMLSGGARGVFRASLASRGARVASRWYLRAWPRLSAFSPCPPRVGCLTLFADGWERDAPLRR